MRDIQDEMITRGAKAMQEEIDREILDSMIAKSLQEDGWTRTEIQDSKNAEVSAWIHMNAKGDYKMVRSQWWFEDGADSVLFLLRWS